MLALPAFKNIIPSSHSRFQAPQRMCWRLPFPDSLASDFLMVFFFFFFRVEISFLLSPPCFFFFSTYWILSRPFSLVSSRVAFSWPLPLSIPTCIKCIRKNQVLPCLLFSSPMKWDSLRWEYHNVYHAPLQLAISWCLLQQIVRPSRGGLCAPAFHTSSRATLKEGASKRNSQCSLRKNQGG